MRRFARAVTNRARQRSWYWNTVSTIKMYFAALECGEVRSLLERSGGSRSGITGLWWPVVDIRGSGDAAREMLFASYARTKCAYVLSVTAFSIDNPRYMGPGTGAGKSSGATPGSSMRDPGFFYPNGLRSKKAQPREQNPVKAVEYPADGESLVSPVRILELAVSLLTLLESTCLHTASIASINIRNVRRATASQGAEKKE
ncbi:hypothetical protein V496_08040 [Pseudogymnoascus sp. VKM F-4515 (FW-2607)]|nr:hypothetical protein V496_08040 [Pseudogymnoascus sp. VKM F-4515 (FW-2607)]